MVPAAMNGPNGMAVLRPPFCCAITNTPDHRAQHEAPVHAHHHLGEAEPAEHQPTEQRELHVTKPPAIWVDEVDHEQRAERQQRAEAGAAEVSPAVIDERRADEAGRGHRQRREDHLVGKTPGPEVDAGERDEARRRDEEGGQLGVGADAPRDQHEQHRGAGLHLRVPDGDRRTARPALSAQEEP